MERILNLLLGAETARWLDRFLPFLFVLCAVPVMIFIAIAAPPGQAPDETAHAIRADSLLHRQFVGWRGAPTKVGDHMEPNSNVMADLGTATIAWDSPSRDQYYGAAAQAHLRGIPWSGRAMVADVPNTAPYAPFLYVPMAAAEGVMRWLGHGPYDAFLAERLTNAATYVLLGAWALFFARRGKFVLFALLLLPPALWLGSTLHPDGVMIGLAILAAALLTRAETSRRSLWAAAAALGLVILARPPVIPLALTLLLPLYPQKDWFRRAIGPFLLASLPALAWMGLVIPRVSVPFSRAENIPGGPLWHGDPTRLFRMTDPGIQLHILLSHPGRIVTMPLETLLHQWPNTLNEAFAVVGVLNLVLPQCMFTLGVAALCAGVLALGRGPANQRWKWLAFIAASGVILVFDAQYMSWTPVGMALIEGVQGRYFFEFLPFLALLGAARPARPVLLLPALTLAMANLVVIPWAVLQAYYVK